VSRGNWCSGPLGNGRRPHAGIRTDIVEALRLVRMPKFLVASACCPRYFNTKCGGGGLAARRGREGGWVVFNRHRLTGLRLRGLQGANSLERICYKLPRGVLAAAREQNANKGFPLARVAPTASAMSNSMILTPFEPPRPVALSPYGRWPDMGRLPLIWTAEPRARAKRRDDSMGCIDAWGQGAGKPKR